MITPPGNSRSLASRGGIVLLLVLVVGAGMYLLGRRSPTKPSSPPPSTVHSAETSTAADSPKSSGRHLAPHDTFYLLEYVSTKTPTGVIGFEPGQEVRLVDVHQGTRTLVVTNGSAQVEVTPDKLTNDMGIAALARRKDQTNQAQIAAYVQSEQKAYDDSQRAAAANFEKAVDKINQRHQEAAKVASNGSQNASSVGSTGTKLDEPAVPVGGSAGYGYNRSAYDGSPYSYFNGSSVSAAAPAIGSTGGTTNPANVGSAGGTGRR